MQSPFSLIDASVVSKLDVYTGGFPLRYGERIGGVVDLATADPRQEPRHFVMLSTYGVGARTAGVISEALNLDGLITARGGLLPNLVDRLDSNVLTPTFTDGLAKLRWRPGRRDHADRRGDVVARQRRRHRIPRAANSPA